MRPSASTGSGASLRFTFGVLPGYGNNPVKLEIDTDGTVQATSFKFTGPKTGYFPSMSPAGFWSGRIQDLRRRIRRYRIADAIFKGRLAENGETLLPAIQKQEELSLIADNLYVFGEMEEDEEGKTVTSDRTSVQSGTFRLR